VAYVKDMFGIAPATPDGEGTPEALSTVTEDSVTSDEAMRLDPHAYTLNKIVERSRRASMDTEHENSAASAHMQAAAQIDRARGLVGEALGEIGDISRGMREKIVAEKNPSHNDAAEYGGKKMPSESEMQEADECVRVADRKEKNRQAEQESDWRLLYVMNGLVAFGWPFFCVQTKRWLSQRNPGIR
jgi:hypothetical protein